jgi:methylated-DNA-protein-cysteine methyltransferase-like protein
MPLIFRDVYRVVKLIPKGKVMSYSGVARQCGYPRAARQVGYALFGLPETLAETVPWWRVVNAAGRISHGYRPEAQRDRLRSEGVVVNNALRMDMRFYDAETIVYRKLSRGKRPARLG